MAHLSTSENRLSEEDRSAMRCRLAEVIRLWPTTYAPTITADLVALMRVAWHAIGCGQDDLRSSEIDEIEHMARQAIDDRAEEVTR